MTITHPFSTTPWPADRPRFHVTWLYTADDRPAVFAGSWIAPGDYAPGGKCGLYLDLVRREGGAVAVAMVADRPDVHAATETLAAWAALPTDRWADIIAPTVAAHPWIGTTHYYEEEKPLLTRWQRAALAWAIVGR
ncbi:hypothetical protein ABH935_007797 [Catenulispora sp. GAS73]|uniref:hypothetical protein n=1 Tax=Catenulispora sp. GAS73 TaxID=3156269 RepID=UPI0035149C2C